MTVYDHEILDLAVKCVLVVFAAVALGIFILGFAAGAWLY